MSVQVSNKQDLSSVVQKKELTSSDDEQPSIDEEEMDSNDASFIQSRDKSNMDQRASGMSSPELSQENGFTVKSFTPESCEEQKNNKGSESDRQQDNIDETESDKTVEGEAEDDQYTNAQAKKMFIIQEVDEESFSEQSFVRKDAKGSALRYQQHTQEG